MEERILSSNKWLGLGLLVLSGVGLYLTMQIDVRTFNDDPGPQLFPAIGFGLLLVCALGIFFSKAPQEPARDNAQARHIEYQRGAVMAGFLVAYSIGLWLVGYYIATPLAVYGCYHLIATAERRVVWRGVLYAGLVTWGVHLSFVSLLKTLLPVGILWG